MYEDEREQAAEVLDQLLAGNLSWVDLADRLVSNFRSVGEICDFVCEYFLDDLNAYKLIKPAEEGRTMVDRCVVFLRSETDYEWPPYPRDGWQDALSFVLPVITSAVLLGAFPIILLRGNYATFFILAIAGFGVLSLTWLWRRKLRSEVESWKSIGDFGVWPFLREPDYCDALRQQSQGYARSGPNDSAADY